MKLENSVQFVRLITGEDLVSEVTEVTTDDFNYYLLRNPMKIVYMTGRKPGMMSLSLIQWVFWKICDDQEFNLSPKDVLMIANTSSSMEEYYWSSLEHINEYREEIDKEDVYEDESSSSDSLETILEALNNTIDKRKLH
jgi:hypothetical protein